MLCGVVACSGPKAIPDKDLVKIFHDAFLANAYISECNITQDSLLLYEPILERHGYTIEDMQFTVRTIASRKSSRLSDLVGQASEILEQEYKSHSYKLVVLDTIDNVAKRYYTRTVFSDSLIKVRRLSDTAKLHIVIKDLVPGEYSISCDYLIDTTDENRNSRVEAYLKKKDGSMDMRHTLMLSRYRESKYSRKYSVDTAHTELHINMFFHHEKDDPMRPGITLKNFVVTRIIPTEQAVDSLFYEQIGALMFNHKFMSGGTSKRHKREKVSLESSVLSAPEPQQAAEPAKPAQEKEQNEKPAPVKAEKPEATKAEKPVAKKPEKPAAEKVEKPAPIKSQQAPVERPQNNNTKVNPQVQQGDNGKLAPGTKIDAQGRIKYDPMKQRPGQMPKPKESNKQGK